MIKLIFLMIFLLIGNYSLRADEVPGADEEFAQDLDSVKNPFEDGLPKPVIVAPPIIKHEAPKVIPKPKPVPPVIKLPELDLQGVIVGEGIQQAIINDQDVDLLGSIKGAQLVAVSKQGVELKYKGKKFFLKVD
jgi:hypothetical protein